MPPESEAETSETEAHKTEVNLSNMTKAQLLKYAEENGIGGVTSGMTKAQMIETINK